MLEGIYKRLSRKVEAYVTGNGGNTEEAADLFQDTIIDLFHQAKAGKLILTCPFDAFFLMVAKRKWLNILKSSGKSSSRVTISTDDVSIGEDSFRQAELIAEQSRKDRIYREQLALMSQRCQEIIKATLTRRHQEEVAADLGVSYNYLRKKKSECLDQLIQQVRAVQ